MPEWLEQCIQTFVPIFVGWLLGILSPAMVTQSDDDVNGLHSSLRSAQSWTSFDTPPRRQRI